MSINVYLTAQIFASDYFSRRVSLVLFEGGGLLPLVALSLMLLGLALFCHDESWGVTGGRRARGY